MFLFRDGIDFAPGFDESSAYWVLCTTMSAKMRTYIQVTVRMLTDYSPGKCGCPVFVASKSYNEVQRERKDTGKRVRIAGLRRKKAVDLRKRMLRKNRHRYFAELILYCISGSGYDTGEKKEPHDRMDMGVYRDV